MTPSSQRHRVGLLFPWQRCHNRCWGSDLAVSVRRFLVQLTCAGWASREEGGAWGGICAFSGNCWGIVVFATSCLKWGRILLHPLLQFFLFCYFLGCVCFVVDSSFFFFFLPSRLFTHRTSNCTFRASSVRHGGWLVSHTVACSIPAYLQRIRRFTGECHLFALCLCSNVFVWNIFCICEFPLAVLRLFKR